MKLIATSTALPTAACTFLLISFILCQLILPVSPFGYLNPHRSISTILSIKSNAATNTPPVSTMSGNKNDHTAQPKTVVAATRDSGSAAAVAPKIDKKESVASTKWLALETWHYTDQEGKKRLWDVATRTTKPKVEADAPPSTPGNTRSTADAVVIIPILKSKTKEGGSNSSVLETILVEQFRPPLQQNTMEFPAGLVDAGETVEQAALRELREETGYTGEFCSLVPDVSRAVCMSPGLATETVHVVLVSVDLDLEVNKNPKTALDDGEYVTIHRTRLDEGMKTLLDTHPAMPIMGLYLFALGFQLGADNATTIANQSNGKKQKT